MSDLNENLEIEELSNEDKKKAINLQDLIYVKKYIDDNHYSKVETDNQLDSKVEAKVESELETAVAAKITENNKNYYTKKDIDDNHYTKAEADTKIDAAIETSSKSYTKEEIDANHYTKTEIDANHYDKTETDETFYKKTDSVTKANSLYDVKSNSYKQISILSESDYSKLENKSNDILYFIKES